MMTAWAPANSALRTWKHAQPSVNTGSTAGSISARSRYLLYKVTLATINKDNRVHRPAGVASDGLAASVVGGGSCIHKHASDGAY